MSKEIVEKKIDKIESSVEDIKKDYDEWVKQFIEKEVIDFILINEKN